MEHATPYVVLATFVINLFITAIGGAVWLARLKYELREYAKTVCEEMHKDLTKKMEEAAREIHDRIDSEIRVSGETGSALRTKIHEVEVFIRDNFISKRSFEMMMTQLNDSIRSSAAEINARLIRGEADRSDIVREIRSLRLSQTKDDDHGS